METTPVTEIGTKKTKQQANYRCAFGLPRCENCAFRRDGNLCEQVEGAIDPDCVCDTWGKK